MPKTSNMPSLFEKETGDSILNRIQLLQASSQRKWGKMSVSQMMAHVNTVMQIATGERIEHPGIFGKIMGPWIKKVVMNEKPFKKDLPTGTSFIIKEDKDFETEKEKLLKTFHQFMNGGPALVEGKIHPLFGKMTAEEWGLSQWKHYDHHLRQFGV